MASQVYETEDITLQDGTEVELSPLPIALLRKFMAAWRDTKNVDVEEDMFDVYVNCVGVSLSPQFKEKFDKTLGTGKLHLNPDYKAYIEEVVDVKTALRIIKVCGGIDLQSPELLQAAAEAAVTAAAEDGKTSTS